MSSEPILYTAAQAARKLNVSDSTFKRHVQPYLVVTLIGDRPLRRWSQRGSR